MNQSNHNRNIGVSGLAAYIPPYRVWLEDWCDWTDNQWPKIREVVGRSFRVRGPDQSVYTMAATAVMRLIEQYDVDPTRVKFLGLGTESSTDNSAGAIIVKGMVDRALEARGLPPLSRRCEVPEFKHACLGGVYGMKGAIRHLALDGAGSQAIVVCADIAEYARGSSGEPTQGAGAVAMLLEEDPKLAVVDLIGSGSASDYRVMDFRKPMSRFCGQDRSQSHQVQDFPVFNGKYSTTCYIDETLQALNDMYEKRQLDPGEYLRSLRAVFMHRPYRRMPETGWAVSYLFALGRGGDAARAELASYCEAAGIDARGRVALAVGMRTSLAVAAVVAGYVVVHEDTVADGVAAHALAGFDNDCAPLVTEDRGEEPLRVGARKRESICMADARGNRLKHHLAFPGAFHVDHFDFQGASRLPGHGSSGFHARTSCFPRSPVVDR